MPGRAEEEGVYDAMAREYAADVESNAYNALHERPGLIALLPPVAGLRVLDAGCAPARSRRGSSSTVRFWRRPLTAMLSAFEEAGFRLERLSEPLPLDECRERFPEA